MQQFQTRSKLKRIPPHNIEAEQAILGTMMLNADCIPVVLSKLKVGDFYSNSHKTIYWVIDGLWKSETNVDTITVTNSLKREEKLDSVGGAGYLANLTSVIPVVSKVEDYCDIVTEKAQLRAMIELGTRLSDQCYEQGSARCASDDFGKKFFEIAAGHNETASFVGDTLEKVMADIDERCKSDKGLVGIPSGYSALDSILSGLPPGDLIILAARPAMGKTALAMNIAENVAKSGVPCLVFSLEMERHRLVERLISTSSGVFLKALRDGLLNINTRPKVNKAVSNIRGMPIIIDDTPALSITQIKAKAKMLHARHTLGLVIVDYLQLARGSGGNREQEIADISRGLKALAKDLNVPIIALSQLNRGLENRENKRPIMSDLRESGAIEQDADTILFVYRDEVYNRDEGNPAKGIAEIIIGKQRSGPTGEIKLRFDGAFTRFSNI
ncbi:replicative DNA helicase [Desulfosediminicola flagellatus]|uniref:replicative DNA helicase n=1 Tax=Desulfosediminicola flagellatus TaxID=2569541 RepID=UPI0010AC567C|nr:replicative DNA helicase [Desulfosediminicola flagellatus]